MLAIAIDKRFIDARYNEKNKNPGPDYLFEMAATMHPFLTKLPFLEVVCSSTTHAEHVRINGRSLNWMGLTRERWCCTRGWMSRLDMNTCQTSIKTDILFSAAVTHIPGLSDRHEITVSSPTELNYEGNLIRQNKGSPKYV